MTVNNEVAPSLTLREPARPLQTRNAPNGAKLRCRQTQVRSTTDQAWADRDEGFLPAFPRLEAVQALATDRRRGRAASRLRRAPAEATAGVPRAFEPRP